MASRLAPVRWAEWASQVEPISTASGVGGVVVRPGQGQCSRWKLVVPMTSQVLARRITQGSWREAARAARAWSTQRRIASTSAGHERVCRTRGSRWPRPPAGPHHPVTVRSVQRSCPRKPTPRVAPNYRFPKGFSPTTVRLPCRDAYSEIRPSAEIGRGLLRKIVGQPEPLCVVHVQRIEFGGGDEP